ncbi:EamA family transporter [Microbacterium sp. P06]|uniref:EamA family transporter n=1 Tax=Microbacterium sp. P06 TaxID=3366949 RepID=UPI0037459FC1
MLSNTRAVLLTALAPLLWGTTYFTATTFVIGGHPLLTAALRALPAGLVLLLIVRRLPRGDWWIKSMVLGALNIGVFFALLFVAADRLPGGVAAIVGGIQPLLVAALASRLLAERLRTSVVAAGVAGIVGVGLIVLRADAGLDPVGVTAALFGALSMATGVVLAKRWQSSEPPLVTTTWQLMAGGLMLALATVALEPLPTEPPTAGQIGGYVYLAIAGTAFAYVVWFRGIAALPTRVPAFLGLLSPIVALGVGMVAAGETLSVAQAAGVGIILLSVVAVIAGSRHPRAPVREDDFTDRARRRG